MDVDHVELYVGDAQQTAFYYCTAFGFRVYGQGGPETGLAGQRSLLLSQGDIRLLLTSGLTADHPATRYVVAHGDGVARLGLRVDDAAAAYAEAVERGAAPVEAPATWRRGDATVVTAAVTGLGDVAHRFVQRGSAGDGFLPGGIELIAPDPEPGDSLLTTVDHLAVCVPADEFAATIRHYETVFGFEQIFEERIEVGDQAMESKVVRSPSGGVTITVVTPDPTRRPGQIDDFLRSHNGPGVQHLAFGTADIVTAVRTLGERGVRFLTTPDSYYDAIASRLGSIGRPLDGLRAGNILVDRDHWGEMFQIFTESTSIRRTFFIELIERHGAVTFGSNNIIALFQAKERERLSAALPQ
jgi:4-hydroxymandelate synthase